MRNRRKPVRASSPSLENIMFAPGEVRVIDGQECLSVEGMYRALLLSREPAARPLVDWIVREVIPSIEKTGAYVLPANMSIPLPSPIAEAFAERLDEMRRAAEQRADDLSRRLGH